MADPLQVSIHRPMWSDYYTITLPNAYTEEMEIDELREWFRIRGANMDKMDKVFDHVYNFQNATVVIENPKEPKRVRLDHEPDI